MRTITITANDRPHHLKDVFDSLRCNDLRKYDKLYCALEPGCMENVYICKAMNNFIPTEIIINKQRLGVRENPFNVLSRVFADGSEFNVYLEDDAVLSPDALDLANHFADTVWTEEYLALCFHNYHSDERKPTKLVTGGDFVAIGFTLTQRAWENYFKPYWNDEAFRIAQGIDIGGQGGWDWCIRAVMKKFNIKCIAPAFSRAMHIGIRGTHCRPEDHERLFAGKTYNKTKVEKFEL